MAKQRTDTESVLKLVLDGKQAETTLKQLSDTQRKWNTEVKNMKPSDPGYREAWKNLQVVNKALEDHKKLMRGVTQEAKSFQTTWKDIAVGIVGGMGITEGIGMIKNFGQQVFDTTAKFQKLEAVLTTTLGSNSQAKMVMQQIQEFAAQTPFQVDQLTDSYVRLANQGFKPSMDQLRSLGDLSASTGKEFNQLAEAIIDAQTGEFERLKEFGIRAEKDGDKVRFTFKGITQEVDFTAASIRNYITELGNIEGVSGSMAAISETLAGKVSNLGDNWEGLLHTVGEETEGVFSAAISLMNDAVSSINSYLTALNTAKKYGAPGTSARERLGELGTMFGIGAGTINGAAIQRSAFASISSDIDQRISGAQYARQVLDVQTDLLERMRNVDRSTREGAAAYALYADKLKLVKDRIEAIKGDRLAEQNIKNSEAAKKAAEEEEKRAKAAQKAAEQRAKQLEKEHDKLKEVAEAMKLDASIGDQSGLNKKLAEISKKYDPLIEKARKFKDEALAGIFADLKAGEIKDAEDANAIGTFDGQRKQTEGLIEKAFSLRSGENQEAFTNGELTEEEYNQKQYDLETQRLVSLKLLYETYGLDSLKFEEQLSARRVELKKEEFEQKKMLLEGEQALADAQMDNFAAGVGLLKGLVNQRGAAFKALLVAEKAIAISQVIMNTQKEIAGYYAAYAPIPGGAAIASGLAAAAKVRSGISIATIVAQGVKELVDSNEPEKTSTNTPSYADGGIVKGPSHAQGGIKLIDGITGALIGEMEGDERIVSKRDRPLVDELLYSGQRRQGMTIGANTQAAIDAERMFRLGGVSPVSGGVPPASIVNNSTYVSNNEEILKVLRELKQSADNAWNFRVLEEAMSKRDAIRDSVNG